MELSERALLRFANYQKAVQNLNTAVNQFGDTELDIIKEGIIQRFEIAHELAWKLLSDILKHEGHTDILGSRSATRLAFNLGLLDKGDVWLAMIESRNITVHAYNPDILQHEFNKIIRQYLPLLSQFSDKIQSLVQTNQS
ncbi:nucleotidyltransferase [Moraxella caviae]|nr:nucleotidyltransferase [Moraxella caviae]